MSTRVLLVDDQPVVRAGFRVLLDLADDLTVVGEAANGLEAIDLACRAKPDVVLMDVRMRGMDGIEATAAIAADPELAGVKVIVLTTFELDEYVFGALRAGASGCLLKDLDADELHAAVRTVAAGQGLLAPSVTRRVIDEFASRTDHAPIAPDRLDVLTDRERDAVRLAAGGLSNEQIAERLVIKRLVEALPSGSYLAISHLSADIQPEAMAELARRLNQTARETFVMRTHAQITCFFDGLDLVEPGVVQVDHWRPPTPKVTTSGGWIPSLYAAVGRKP